MSTLAEIENAAEALPPEQKEALFRFLAARLRVEVAETSPPRRPRTKAETLAAIEASPIRFTANWEALKEQVR